MAQPPDNIAKPVTDLPPVTGVAKAAGIISLGNVASRVLGLARESVKANLFGATGLVSAFEVANIVPTMIFDLLIGGMISSALVPVLSDYVGPEGERKEFWRLASTLLSLAAVFLAAFVVLAELLAPQIAWLFGARNFDDPTLWPISTQLLRIMLPAVLFLNLSGLLTGILYSLKRFTLPAFTAAAFNTSIVVVSPRSMIGRQCDLTRIERPEITSGSFFRVPSCVSSDNGGASPWLGVCSPSRLKAAVLGVGVEVGSGAGDRDHTPSSP